MQIKYRADVDGLRALAVLAVVAFHLHPSMPHGGFVGVDVFFVISGYLISAILIKEIEVRQFSILKFYERRLRRIFPALMVMLAAVSIASIAVMLPGELVAYSKSLLGAAFSYSNIFFWSTTGYFDGPASTKPLLHTWSLAVEEQFYIVFPLFLYFMHRHAPRLLRASVLSLALASLIIAAWLVEQSPQTAFYMPYTRAWELLTGSMLSLRMLPLFRKRYMRETAALVGLAMVAAATAHYSYETPFPGLAALLPCVGAALIIQAGASGKTMVGQLLSVRPLVFVGLISYSVYLWHWPLIFFTNIWFPRASTHGYFFAAWMLCLSLCLGALSWRFIESPMRKGRLRALSQRQVFESAAGVFATICLISAIFLASNGLASRFPAQAIAIAAYADNPQQMRTGQCFISSLDRMETFNADLCLHQKTGVKNVLLLGDSHAAALWYGLSRELPGLNIMQANFAGCPPLLGVSPRKLCGQFAQYIFGDYLEKHRIDGIILSERWAENQSFEHEAATIAWAHAHAIPVTVIGPVPEYDAPLPKLLAYEIKGGGADLPSSHLKADLFTIDRELALKATTVWKVNYISALGALCKGQNCQEYVDDTHTTPLLADSNHLTNAASSYLIRQLTARGQFSVTDGAQAPESLVSNVMSVSLSAPVTASFDNSVTQLDTLEKVQK